MIRVIGTSLDNNYRDDLNYNFGLLSSTINNVVNGSGSDKDNILEMIDNLQKQINAIVGSDIEDLLNRVNQAVIEADIAAKRAGQAATDSEATTQLANAAAALANANAIAAEQATIRAEKISDEMVILKEETEVAKDNAIEASKAINEVLPNVQGLENKDTWNVNTLYKKNNFVLHEGNGYMALKENAGATPPIPPEYSNEYWSVYTERGLIGETGVGLNVIGELNSVGELPPTGNKGDAYIINGLIYPWSENTQSWGNGVNIKGEKGDPGDVTQAEIGINRYKLETTIKSQSSWKIPLVTFSPKDAIIVIRNTTVLDEGMYVIEEKVDGLYVTLRITAITEISENNLSVIIFKNKAVIPDDTFDGSLLKNESVTLPKLSIEIQESLSETKDISRQNQTIQHGFSVINGEVGSPVDIEIQGRTLVNLIYGASPFTVTLVNTKYYLLVKDDTTAITVDGISQNIPHKFTGKNTTTLTWTTGQPALYEIDRADYNKVLTDWNGVEVLKRYPYVKDTQHLQHIAFFADGASLFADVKLGEIGTTKDILYKDNGRWMLRKATEKDFELDGGISWKFDTNKTGYKAFSATTTEFPGVQWGADAGKYIMNKYDGSLLKYGSVSTNYDYFNILNPTNLYISISNNDSGFPESYTPTTDEIKAYFNGWQVKTANSANKPIAWKSIVNGADTATQTLAYVSANKAPGYTPYKLSYVLTTPQIIDATDKVEGDIVINGLTQVEVTSGFSYTTDSNTGKRKYTLTPEKDRYKETVNATEVKLTYANNIRTALDDVVVKQSDIATNVSINSNAIIDLYVRLKALEG